MLLERLSEARSLARLGAFSAADANFHACDDLVRACERWRPVHGRTRFSGNARQMQWTVAELLRDRSGCCNGIQTTNLPCAFNDARFLWDDQINDVAWVGTGGDIYDISNDQDWRIGWQTDGTDGNGNYSRAAEPWCKARGNSACGIPQPPTGSSSLHTVIRGSNYAACSTGTYARVVPDPAKITTLRAGHGVGYMLDLQETQWVDFQCVKVATFGGCVEFGSGHPCNKDSSNGQPISDFGSLGIAFDAPIRSDVTYVDASGVTRQNTVGRGTIGSDHISFKDFWLQGPMSKGTTGLMEGELTFDDWLVDQVGNIGLNNEANSPQGITCQNGPEQGDICPTGVHLNSELKGGNWHGSHLTIRLTGFPYKYADKDTYAIPTFGGFAEGGGGNGDGVGSPNRSKNWNFQCDYCASYYNTQDAMDFGHDNEAVLTFTHNLFYGNSGGSFKLGLGHKATIINSIAINNCMRLTELLPGASPGSNLTVTSPCRAVGDGLGVNFGNYPGQFAHFIGNILVGANGTLIDAQNGSNTTNTPYDFIFRDNIALCVQNPAVENYLHLGHAAGLIYGSGQPTVEDHNLEYGCYGGSSLSAASDLHADPKYHNQPQNGYSPEAGTWENFDWSTFFSTSPALGAGIADATLTDDYFGAARPSSGPMPLAAVNYIPANASPSFPQPPANMTADEGDGAKFTAAVDGYPVPTCQWSKAGVAISGATNCSSLNVATPLSASGSTYTLAATNSQGTTTSPTVTLTVKPYTMVSSTFAGWADETAPTGYRAVATGFYAGNSYIKFHTGFSMVVDTTGTYTSSGGQKRCLTFAQAPAGAEVFGPVVNGAGTNTGSAVGYIIYNRTGSYRVAKIAAGGYTDIATATGTQSNTSELCIKSQNGTITATADGNPLISITDTTYSGGYPGIAGSDYGGTLGQASSFRTGPSGTPPANSAPVITTQPASVTSTATATFTAGASGTPTPTVQWYSTAPGGSSGTAILGATSTSYATPASSTANSGAKFYAVFTNTAGSVTTGQATWTVNAAPTTTSCSRWCGNMAVSGNLKVQ